MRYLAIALLFFPLGSAHATDYLSPLGANGVDLYAGYSDFLAKLDIKNYYEESAIYTYRVTYLGILQNDDDNQYYLIYATSKPKFTIYKMELPEDFAKGVSYRLADIIQDNTRYPPRSKDSLGRIECTDDVPYIFESGNMYGVSDCSAGRLGRQLDDVADKLMELASQQSLSDGEKKKRMSDILSLISALDRN
jgi:hypothetical protein